jgi:hypothetical protein
MSLSYYFSHSKPNLKFLVTEIDCGIAGFTVEQIAPLFNKAIDENRHLRLAQNRNDRPFSPKQSEFFLRDNNILCIYSNIVFVGILFRV